MSDQAKSFPSSKKPSNRDLGRGHPSHRPGWFGRTVHQGRRLLRSLWQNSVEIFKFLPIRIKLSLIIATIVIGVISVFGAVVLHSQRAALMNRMTQVCNVMIRSLAETIKGDLLLGNHDKVTEAVLRLQRTTIEGLEQVAVFNRKAELVGYFHVHDQKPKFEDPVRFLQYDEFTTVEGDDRFEYIYPITTTLQERGVDKQILLGVTYVRFSRQAIMAPIRRAQDVGLGAGFLVILVSIVAINIIAAKMARQIHLLSDGAREVGQGNLDVQIAVSTKDELGQLAQEFNNMIQHLREKLHMQKFVSKFTMDMIKDTIRSKEKMGGARIREVAVLFSDVRNFSTVAEKLAPEDIVKLINIYFDVQTRIIEKHHGVVDKFMGDQIMAVFEGPNMADNVLRSAVEIQRALRALNQERARRNEVTLEVGIGINNGSAISGHMGSKSRMDYTVIGDVVNVAARLCAQARAGQIITSLELARKVNGSYPTTRLSSVNVKGRSQTVRVCEVDYGREILM